MKKFKNLLTRCSYLDPWGRQLEHFHQKVIKKQVQKKSEKPYGLLYS